jgi:hypothetical protein
MLAHNTTPKMMSKPAWKPSKPATPATMEKVNAAVTTDYPALSPIVGAPKTTLNFKKTVEAAAARIEAPVPQPAPAAKPKRVVFSQQEDDEDYDEQEQEFNADLINDRRRGDKGVW